MRARRLIMACMGVVAVWRSAHAQDSGAVRMAAVTYLTATSAYIDAGRDAGLREGVTVQVVRGGSVIATLRVAFLASHQASCDIVTENVPIVVGDSVRFTAAPAGADTAVATAVPTPPRGIGGPSLLRGRIGAHYLMMGRGGGAGFSQPSLDVQFEGRAGPTNPFGIAMDLRARRTTTSMSTGATVVDGHARAYQMALYWNPPASPVRVTVGRQMATAVASIGLLDGVSAELNRTGWTAGLFGGSQPEPDNLGFATDIVEAGAYVQRHGPRVAGAHQWSATLGLSGSYQNSQANREFAFLQGFYSSRRFMTLVSQEIDYYQPWKRTTGMPAVSFTSTLATARLRASDNVDLHVGFDNRRNVLLYRDAVNPVTTFDDAFRQGVWAGAAFRFGGHYTGGVEARRSSGGATGAAQAYTGSLGTDRLLGSSTSLRVRSTYFQSPIMNGWLHSAALAADPGAGRLHVELSGGARIERDPLAIPATSTTTWIGTDLDWNLARAWYVLVSASVERGGLDPASLLYTGFSVRF